MSNYQSFGDEYIGSDRLTVCNPFQTTFSKCIHLIDCFDHRNHICIVTRLLSCSVFDFLKDNNYLSFPLAHIQSFAKQLLTSVACEWQLRLRVLPSDTWLNQLARLSQSCTISDSCTRISSQRTFSSSIATLSRCHIG